MEETEEIFIYHCTDCGYVGSNFTEECLPLGNSGEWTIFFLCPECVSHAGHIL